MACCTSRLLRSSRVNQWLLHFTYLKVQHKYNQFCAVKSMVVALLQLEERDTKEVVIKLVLRAEGGLCSFTRVCVGRKVGETRFSTVFCGNVIDIAHSTVLTRLDHKTKVKW